MSGSKFTSQNDAALPDSSGADATLTEAEPRYADFQKRVLAAIIDLVLIFILIGLIAAGFSFVVVDVLVPNFPLLIFWLYFSCFESSKVQATPGKLALQIAVTDAAGKRIGFFRASWRCVGKALVLMTFGLGLISSMFDSKRRGLDDFIAGTRVYDLALTENRKKSSLISNLIGLAVMLAVIGCFVFLERTQQDLQNRHVIAGLIQEINQGLQQPYELYYQDQQRFPTPSDLHFQNLAVDSFEIDANGDLIVHVNKPKAAVLRLTPQIDKVKGFQFWDCKVESEIADQYPMPCRK